MMNSNKSMSSPWRSSFLRVVLFVLLASGTSLAKKYRLVIGGFAGIRIEKEGWSSAGVIPAVDLALQRVNNHSDILSDYYLDIEWKDSRCDSGYSIKGLVEHITESPPKIVVLGPGCSIAAYPVATTLPFWNLTQISFSLTSPDLSNNRNIYRVNPSETIQDPALLKLTDLFDWNRLFIIKHELRIFNTVTELLQTTLLRKNKQVHVIGYLNNTTSTIDTLKGKDARIIILLMYEDRAREIICSGYRNNFYGSNIVWILRGWYRHNWWTVKDVRCGVEEMKKAITNVLYVDHVNYGSDEGVEVLGLNKSQFTKEYKKLIRNKNTSIYTDNKYAPYGYDAVVMLAHALNATEEILKTTNESLRNFTYKHGANITALIKKMINKTANIKGLTGDIKLDERGDRIIDVWLQQLQNFTVVNVALYHTENDSISFMPSKKFIWADGNVPLDKRAQTKILLCLSRSIFWAVFVASICGIFAAFYFLWINVRNGSKRFFKMSTPPLNNLMILGAIIGYIFVPIHALKSCTMEQTVVNSSLCKVDAFLISISFSLVFGSIFMKTWRIYKIFTNVKLSKELRFLTNKNLVAFVILFVLFDSIYLLIWSVVHPLQDSVQEVLTEANAVEEKVYFVHRCTSPYYRHWFFGMVGYKGLLVLFGVFLSWETRNVSFPGLNDSKYIGICVYNIFIVSIVVLPLKLFVFSRQVDAGYCITAGSIIFCTTATLVLMFFSKIRPEKKPEVPSHPTMSIDQTVNDKRPGSNAVSQCPTCKQKYM